MTGLVKDATDNDLSYRVIGAAMAVHNAIGQGYKNESSTNQRLRAVNELETEAADGGWRKFVHSLPHSLTADPSSSRRMEYLRNSTVLEGEIKP